MLSPDDRTLYTDALRPPSGFRFDEGIATTYTLDLTTLLTIPLHLALYSAEHGVDALLGDGIALLEALRDTSGRVDVYCQRGRIMNPPAPRVLFSLLEPMIQEAAAPGGGSFHAKLWLLRFRAAANGRPLLRLLVPSRNLTHDRCWDVALTLEGEPGAERREDNAELARLVRTLPSLSTSAGEDSARRAGSLAADVERAEWQLPDGYDQVAFHALGLGGAPWPFPYCNRLAVVSPFLSPSVVQRLSDGANEPKALVSRPEELDVQGDALGAFAAVKVLHESAESEDGDATPERAEPGVLLRGLHAKLYLMEKGWQTHVFLGSANATVAALVSGANVEILAEIIGQRATVGSIDQFLGPDGFGTLLNDYVDAGTVIDEAVEAAEKLLDRVRESIAAAGIAAEISKDGDGWSMRLSARRPIDLPDDVHLRVWPITVRAESGVDGRPLSRGEPTDLTVADVAHLTSLVAFGLRLERPRMDVSALTDGVLVHFLRDPAR